MDYILHTTVYQLHKGLWSHVMAKHTELESILWYHHDVILYFLSNKFLLNQHLMLFPRKDFLDIKTVLWKFLWSFSDIYRAVSECIWTSGCTVPRFLSVKKVDIKIVLLIFKNETTDQWKNSPELFTSSPKFSVCGETV